MGMFNIKKFMFAGAVGFVMLVGLSVDTNAQSRRDMERERQRIERENARYQRERQRRNRANRNDSVVTGRMVQRVNNANFNNGYQQGFLAGEYDRRGGKYNRSNVYRDSGSYPNEGDPTSSDYIYRQGYLQGYNDGFRGVRNY